MDRQPLMMFVIAVMLMVFAGMCGCVEENLVSFETVDKGTNSNHSEKQNYVIINENSWDDLWDIVKSGYYTKPDLPYVDFNESMILAVFQGFKNTGGYSIEVTRIVENGEMFEVFIREVSPEPDEIVIEVLTYPYHIVKIDKTDKEVVFTYETS